MIEPVDIHLIKYLIGYFLDSPIEYPIVYFADKILNMELKYGTSVGAQDLRISS